MNNITTPRFSLNPLNHPRPRFLSYSVMPILLSLLAGLFVLTACEEETAAPKKDSPPSIAAIEDQTVQAGGNSITVNITASDPDGEIPSLDYSPELLYATFTDRGDGTATLVFNPGREVDPVATNITITATSDGLTDTEIFTLTITPPDNPPSINPINDVFVQAGGSSITVNISATDPDDGQTPSLTYSPILLYATLTTNDNGTATLVFNPGLDVPLGDTNITITASSGELTDIEQFTLTITNTAVDNPPTINPINDVSVQAGGSSITVNISASDPDGEIPSLDYSPELLYATFTDNLNGTATLVFNPGREVDPGDTNIIITASSGELTNMEQFTLTITDPKDRPPLITAIENQTVPAGSSLTVIITASDPDPDQTPTLSYSPELPYASLTTNDNGTADLLFEPDRNVSSGDTTITITASSGELTDTEVFILTITPPDRPPTIDSISPDPVSVAIGKTTNVTVSASDPDPGDTPTFSLVNNDLDFITLDDLRNGTATINIAPLDPNTSMHVGRHRITVKASSGSLFAETNFTLIITDDDSDSDGTVDSLDVDDDDDGLIEINSLEDLHNIRHNLAGTSYKTSAADTGNINGAPGSGLKGYELTRDLDFNDPASYSSGVVNSAWTTGSGWLPIGDNSTGNDNTRFSGILEGNGYTITNLMISNDLFYIGLFGYIGTTGQVRNLGIENAVADYAGNSDFDNFIGLLAGQSQGTNVAVHTSGIVNGGAHSDHVGGLVGFNNGTITACYATGGAGGNDRVGGLVGNNTGTITACYSTGNANGGADGFDAVGGLVGNNTGTITACYSTGNADGGAGGNDFVGGLVGFNTGTIRACYGFGMVTGETPGVDRSGDASDSTTVGTASALTMANSSMMNDNRWPARVWDFGTDSQVPVLKWITGYNSRGDTDEAKYPCDPALLPAGRSCGDIIPGQGR